MENLTEVAVDRRKRYQRLPAPSHSKACGLPRGRGSCGQTQKVHWLVKDGHVRTKLDHCGLQAQSLVLGALSAPLLPRGPAQL